MNFLAKWLIYILLRIKLHLTERWSRFRYSHSWKSTAKECGVIPADWEWRFEQPSLDSKENIFLYGVNSAGGSIFLRINWNPYGHSNTKFIYRHEDGTSYSMDEAGRSKIDLQRDGQVLEYKVPGLSVEVVSPFRILRLKVRGYLKKLGSDEMVFAKIRLLWHPVSEVFDCTSDYDEAQLAASVANGQERFRVHSPQIEDRYEQYGNMKGEVQIYDQNEGLIEDREVFFWGHRAKTMDDSRRHRNQMHTVGYEEEGQARNRINRICGYDQYGYGFSLSRVSNGDGSSSYFIGHGFGGRYVMPIKVTNLHELGQDLDPEFIVKDGMEFMILVDREFEIRLLPGGKLIRSVGVCEMSLNGHRGQCFIWREDQHMIESPNIDHSPLNSPVRMIRFNANVNKPMPRQHLVVMLDETVAENERLCGGKGASLATLTRMSKSMANDLLEQGHFRVPKGVIVTTYSFQMFLDENPTLKNALLELQRRVWSEGNTTNESVSLACEQVVQLVQACLLPSKARQVLKEKLHHVFGREKDSKMFAVRSSACGEDSEEMSAAGQMTTYLGVKGFDKVCESIVKCWSSEFRPIAVEYKRSHGQMIAASMAVVIQEMVDCDSAGVLFTCDPYNGDERRMIITGNYGLGESVVSALSEPDTIRIKIQIDQNSFDSERMVSGIESIEIGKKQKMIKLGKDMDVEEVDPENDASKRNHCCLSTTEIINLANMGLRVSSFYSTGPRDIEWGIKGGEVYCLQCRPVTGLDSQWTEYELTHELDSGMTSENEFYSKANVGEVFGEACSPLGRSVTLWYLFQLWFYKRRFIVGGRDRPYVPFVNTCPSNAHHTFLGMTNGGLPFHDDNAMIKALIVSLFGHDINEPDLVKLASERFAAPSFKEKFGRFKGTLRVFFMNDNDIKKMKRSQKFLRMERDLLYARNFTDSKSFYHHIVHLLSDHVRVAGLHCEMSVASSFANMMVLGILAKSPDKSHMWSDFAHLLSKCKDVISADVPSALNKLAGSIEDPEKFLQMSDEDALAYLMKTPSTSGRKFKEFMEKHGYRGFMEFDVQREVWCQNPILLIRSIKAIIPTLRKSKIEMMEEEVDNVSPKKLIESLQTPLTGFQKWLLEKYFLPRSHKRVGWREETKAFWIYCNHLFRLAYMDLAKWMTYQEGFLPDVKLLAFMTLEEIERLLETRDPLLIIKAKRRQKLWPKLNQYRFPEIVRGPKIIPINMSKPLQPKSDGSQVILKGTPVCAGIVEARACVAVYLEDAANNLQPGDVLITYSTDIGWSPYFPALAGIATEIGGLMSHGAVIAREYGIPCIIGASGGTQLIKTGDIVQLDATNGRIAVLKTVEAENNNRSQS